MAPFFYSHESKDMANKRTIIGSDDNPDHQVEVHGDQELEPIVNQEFDRTVAEEAFMNELVEIEVAPTTDDNAPSSFVLNVNNVNQPIMRGVPIKVKRKYVEVLARCKETRHTQPVRDMTNPEAGNALIGRTALAYPFQVLQDSGKGMAWLRAVMAEAN